MRPARTQLAQVPGQAALALQLSAVRAGSPVRCLVVVGSLVRVALRLPQHFHLPLFPLSLLLLLDLRPQQVSSQRWRSSRRSAPSMAGSGLDPSMLARAAVLAVLVPVPLALVLQQVAAAG